MDGLIYLLSKPFFGWLLFVAPNFGNYDVGVTTVIMYTVCFGAASAVVTYLLVQHLAFRASAIFARNFKMLDEKFREEKLRFYAKSKGKYKSVAAGILINDFDIISKDLREELIRKFSEGSLKNVIVETEDHAISMEIIEANVSLVVLMKKFNDISAGLRNEMLKKFIVQGTKNDKDMVSKIFFEHFKFIPGELCDEIFLKLERENSNEIEYNFSEILSRYFMDVPKDTRNALILNFSNSKYAPTFENSINIILNNFFRIPNNTRESAIKNYARNARSRDLYHVKEVVNKYGKYLPPQMVESLLNKVR